MNSWDSYHAVTTLLYRYAEAIDLADFDTIGELFTHATMTNEGYPGEIRGGEAIGALYRTSNRVHPNGTLMTRHVTTNAIVEIDDVSGSGTVRSYFTVLQCTPTLPLQVIVAGRYHDRFERVAGVWRFAHRHVLLEAVGDVHEHLLIDLASLRSDER